MVKRRYKGLPPVERKFDGKTFSVISRSDKSKRIMNGVQDNYKKRGYHTRMVKRKGKYYLYTKLKR